MLASFKYRPTHEELTNNETTFETVVFSLFCWPQTSHDVPGEHGYDELNHAELLDLMGVQGLLTGGGNAVSITVC